MTPRIVASLIVASALFVPMTLTAQTFIPKDSTLPQVKFSPVQRTPIPSNLSITVNPGQPARLKYVGSSQTFDAQSETAKLTYEATGLTVEMSSGDYTATARAEPWESRVRGRFLTLHLTFATNGDLISYRLTN